MQLKEFSNFFCPRIWFLKQSRLTISASTDLLYAAKTSPEFVCLSEIFVFTLKYKVLSNPQLHSKNMLMNHVLSLSNITKSYGSVQALKGVSFTVPEGSVFGILGPNGSGKTTLLSIILDVLKANSGNFLWFGQPGSPEAAKEDRFVAGNAEFLSLLIGC
jgi:ABC-type glutathione transport system ATPase component